MLVHIDKQQTNQLKQTQEQTNLKNQPIESKRHVDMWRFNERMTRLHYKLQLTTLEDYDRGKLVNPP